MRHWAFYHTTTGEFSERTLFCSSRAVAEANAPEGHSLIEGRFDRLTQRVDTETGQVVPYDNPLKQQRDREQAARHRQARIDGLERRQLRAMREILLGDESARARLQAVEDEIVRLRAEL